VVEAALKWSAFHPMRRANIRNQGMDFSGWFRPCTTPIKLFQGGIPHSNSMKKPLFSRAVILVMILSLLPGRASAAGEETISLLGLEMPLEVGVGILLVGGALVVGGVGAGIYAYRENEQDDREDRHGGGPQFSGDENSVVVVNKTAQGQAVAALSGKVTINYDDGRPSVVIDAGTGAILDAKGSPIVDANGKTIKTLAELIKDDKAAGGQLSAALLASVKTIATATGSANAGSVSQLTTNLAAMIKVVSQADPEGAAGLVSAAVGALTASGSSGESIQQAITAVVAAASVSDGVNQTTIMAAATDAAKANNVEFTQQTFSSTSITNVISTGPVALDVSVISKAN